jgi:hypothetical protein
MPDFGLRVRPVGAGDVEVGEVMAPEVLQVLDATYVAVTAHRLAKLPSPVSQEKVVGVGGQVAPGEVVEALVPADTALWNIPLHFINEARLGSVVH